MIGFNLICIVIILCFVSIQFIEISSFFARYSGIFLGKKTLAYTLQNAVFMLTRFFTMALLPLLGLLIDLGIDKVSYLRMVSYSFIFSGIIGVVIIWFRAYIISGFSSVLENVGNGKSLFYNLLKLPLFILSSKKLYIKSPNPISLVKSKIFWLSTIVFSIYALSVFMVFFLSLSFSDYRASISQLSGVINAFATVILTFIIEPKISIAIDSDRRDKALDMIFSLIIGRVIGVGCLSQIIIIFMVIL
ncbi:lipid II flippase Amj family protein [Gallibacterium anatis]|uniref:lipid II flippase Amj family protein n=1 Tax=Gallibacterium anatis TaxID=750 RepID=UPI002232540C|nr:lipid II flippase Amj family protein [Gallibacterium anatis]UZD16899.1 lipid II flippase Amj family protein [Gallibacterium anatis]